MSERNKKIDILKGFGIILVILGHLPICAYVKSWIYLFHMPLFFYLSGYLHRNKYISFTGYVKNKVKTLLWPYYIWGILYIIFESSLAFLKNQMSWRFLEKQFFALIYGNYIWERNDIYIGVLWFLLAMFWVSCIFEIICQVTEKSNVRFGICCILSGCGFVICNICRMYQIRLPMSIDVALVAIAFYALGEHTNRNKEKTRCFFINIPVKIYLKTVWVGVFWILLGSGFGILNCIILKKMTGLIRVDMLTIAFGNKLLYIIASMMIIKGLWNLADIILRQEQCVILLSLIGRNSLLIMILHLKVLDILLILESSIHIELLNFVLFLIDITVSLILAVIIKRKLPFLLRWK